MEPAKKKLKCNQICIKVEELDDTVQRNFEEASEISKFINYIRNDPENHLKVCEQVRSAMYTWYIACVNKGLMVSNNQIKEKAIKYNKQLGGRTDFVASSSFLLKWKKQYQIPPPNFQNRCDEFVKEYFHKRLIDIIEEYQLSRDQIFICGEVKIDSKALPTMETIHQLENEALGENNLNNKSADTSNELTIMICSNTSGTLKLPLMVIGKSKISSYKKLPVYYKYRDRELIGGQAFNEWHKEEYTPRLNGFLKRKKLPPLAILIVNHFQTSGTLIPDKAQTIYLPRKASNMTAVLNRKILKEFKLRFWLKMLSCLQFEQLGLKIEEVLFLLAEAWNKTSVSEYLHFLNKDLPDIATIKIEIDEEKKLVSNLRSVIEQFQGVENKELQIKKIEEIYIKSEEPETIIGIELDSMSFKLEENEDNSEEDCEIISEKVKDELNSESEEYEEIETSTTSEKDTVELPKVSLEDCITSLENVICFFKSRSKYDEHTEEIKLLRRLVNKATDLELEDDDY